MTTDNNNNSNRQHDKQSSSTMSSRSMTSLRVVTVVMVAFSLMTYLQDFKTLNVNVAYTVQFPKDDEKQQQQEDDSSSARDLGEGTTTTLSSSSTTRRSNGEYPTRAGEEGFIPLPELTRADETVECPEGLFPVEMVVNLTADAGVGRKIPKIIHQTGEGKCMTPAFYNNAKAWGAFEGYSFYFHDTHAKARLLQKYWPQFPQLQNSFECLKNAGGAAIADLWRYLAIWEYGGVYVDMDDAPAKLFNATTLTPDMDAFFLVERIGILSQYFFALSPKHPVMYLAVHEVMEAMHQLPDTGTFSVPHITGPSCVKRAFLKFMGTHDKDEKNPDYWKYRHPPAGWYQGVIDPTRSVTVAANRTTQDNWVYRDALKRQGRKKKGWAAMNYTNYQKLNKVPSNKTCLQLIMEKYATENTAMEELRQQQQQQQQQ